MVGVRSTGVESLLGWAILLGGLALSAKLWPNLWKGPKGLPWQVPRPALSAGLPPGADEARRGPIEDARPGDYIAVVGKVMEPAELAGPISKRPCVAYDLVLRDSIRGERVARVLRGSTFTLSTGGTTAVVDARGAFIRLEHDRLGTAFARGRFEDGVIPPESPGEHFVADEGVIAPGEYVLVIGVVETASNDVGYRSSADVRLRLDGGGVRPSVVSSVPADLHTFKR